MTDPSPPRRSLPNRWTLSPPLVAGLLSVIAVAAAAIQTTDAALLGNEVDHPSITAGSNTLLSAIDPRSAPAERRAEHRAADGTSQWVGQSALYVRGACLDDGSTCVGGTTNEDGAFFLDAVSTGGQVTVSWRAVNDSLRTLRVGIAGLVIEGESPLRVQMIGLDAGEHAIHVEPARPVLGSHDQLVDWIATFALTTPFPTVETRGISSYETLAGCALGSCAPLTRHSSDTVIVPWRAQGTLTASWDARDGPMRLTIPGTGFVAEGRPPLTIDVSGLTAGEWAIQVEPASFALPTSAGTVGWLAALVRANSGG